MFRKLFQFVSAIIQKIDFTDVISSLKGQEKKDQEDGLDELDFSLLEWVYGGFGGSNAVPDEAAQICKLDVGQDMMTYEWVKGGCETFGAPNKGDADFALACLFILKDGHWKGGKFDWISTSRTRRDFKNIIENYHGWPSDAIETAEGYAFVIVGRDGRTRTNVIVQVR